MNRKPVGVILAAVVLGCFSLMLVLAAVLTVFSGVMMRHLPAMASPPPGAPAPGAMLAIFCVAAVFYLALAAWGGATTIGLFRTRRWASISIMVIGGCLAAIGLLAALGSIAARFMMASVPMPPEANPAALHGVFIVMALAWVVVACIGSWWVIYFALRRTRAVFAEAELLRAGGLTASQPPSTLADFSVAEPVAYANPLSPSQPDLPSPGVYTAPAIAPASGRPVSMSILAILFFLGGCIAFLEIFSHMPMFLLGKVFTGGAAKVVIAFWALTTAYAGFGLWKLQKPGWIVTFALMCFSALNSLLCLLPGYRASMVAYTQSAQATVTSVMPPPSSTAFHPVLPTQFLSAMLLFGAVFGLAVTAFLLILLWRARWAYGLGGKVATA